MKNDDILNPLETRKLIGLNNYFDDLIKLYDLKILPKVMLISGKKGLGKFTLINHFLNYIFSKKTYDLNKKIISAKSEVFNKQLKGVFENIVHIKNEGIQKIKIDDVRKLKSLLLKAPINGNFRFVILDDVEQLNKNSSNALLKIIEEPTEHNYFILIDNQENHMIETISSRCLKIKIFLNKEEEIRIIQSLVEEKKINKTLKENNLDLSPGQFIRYNNLCLENDITHDLEYLEKVEKLLNLYKKSKNKMFINLSILFTNEHFYNLSLKERRQIFLLNSIKNKIIHYINDFFVYNLNLSSVLNLIHAQFTHAK